MSAHFIVHNSHLLNRLYTLQSLTLMPQTRLILDVALLTSTVLALATAFYFGILFPKFIPWPVRAILLGSSALAVWILLWITPVRYSVEGSVVRLCFPVRCVEYKVEGWRRARSTTLACGKSGFSVAASAGSNWRGPGAPTTTSTSPPCSAETCRKSSKSAKATKDTPCGCASVAVVKAKSLTDLALIFAH